MITLRDKQGKEIQAQYKIMERIEEFYSELYDSDHAVTIQTYPEEVPPIMTWEVEAALRKMKNGKEAGKYQVNNETLKAGNETIAKQLAKLYTKCITERLIPKTWKEANMVICFKKGNRKDIKNYRPICLLSNMYKLFTKIITTRLEKKLDENQPREQAGFRSKYSTTDHIHAINQLNVCCFRGLREGIRSSTNPSNIDIIARTRNRRCLHRNPERHIYGQLSDSTSAQRE